MSLLPVRRPRQRVHKPFRSPIFCVGKRKWLSIPLLAVGFVLVLRWQSHRQPEHAPAFEHTIPEVHEFPPVFSVEEVYEDLDTEVWNMRAEKVKDAFVFAYNGYIEHAWKADELRPASARRVRNFNGWGVTIFDSLDTMWIMGLHDLWRKSVDAVSEVSFTQEKHEFTPFFETTIRYLGGLLSAFAISGEKILLDKANELGLALLPAFSSPSGLPYFSVNTVTGNYKSGRHSSALFAEIMTCQLEFKYLAHLTGNEAYFHKANDVVKTIHSAGIEGSAFPETWDTESGRPKPMRHYSMGSGADSGFEYLLKQYLLTSKTEPMARDMYVESMNTAIDKLFYVSPSRQMLYVTDINRDVTRYRLEQLSCFLPGLLLLGVHSLELPPRTAQLHKWAAEGLAQTCWLSYADQRAKLAPDTISMHHKYPTANITGRWMDALKQWEMDGKPTGIPPGLRTINPIVQPPNSAMDKDYFMQRATYLLRPEMLESIFIFWKLTGDQKWRHRAWTIFNAIETHAKTRFGYGIVNRVDSTQPGIGDEMPSYFLAETLKYLYLTFSDKDHIPLDKWVFNTEGHPLPIFNWNDTERNAYGL